MVEHRHEDQHPARAFGGAERPVEAEAPGFGCEAVLEGRGVGLALVRSIVEAAGGAVDVTADPTTFQVILPGRSA